MLDKQAIQILVGSITESFIEQEIGIVLDKEREILFKAIAIGMLEGYDLCLADYKKIIASPESNLPK